MAFIKHSFNYEEYFKTLYTAIAEAILQANDSTIVQPELKEIEKLRDEMLKVSPMYKEYQAWNESSKGIVVPFQHADIYYHILHRLQIWRQENRCNRIEEQDLLNVLREVFEQIQKQLKEQNNAYDGIPNWEQNFVQCPFVEKVLNKKTPIADEAFGRLITLFAQKSIVNKQLKVLKDELTTSDDLDEKYLDW